MRNPNELDLTKDCGAQNHGELARSGICLSANEQKKLAAKIAVDTLIEQGRIFSGMKIGLGTGSTAMFAMERIAERIADATLTDIKAVATSFQTENRCRALAIPLFTLNDPVIGGALDLTIDGADAIDNNNNLIKGGGGALLREKVAAYCSKNYVIVADESKLASALGADFPVPVEIIGFARLSVENEMTKLGARCVLREGVKKCGPVITDNGNQILDCLWEKAVNSAEMEAKINAIAGVVENGFFTKTRATIFIGGSGGLVRTRG